MKIHERFNGGATVLEIHGQIVGGPDADLFHASMAELAQRGVERVVLNLRNVRRINSCGAGILLRELRLS